MRSKKPQNVKEMERNEIANLSLDKVLNVELAMHVRMFSRAIVIYWQRDLIRFVVLKIHKVLLSIPSPRSVWSELAYF